MKKSRWLTKISRLALLAGFAIPTFFQSLGQAQSLSDSEMLAQMNQTIDYVKARQLPAKNWSGAFVTDVTQDGTLLIAGKFIGLLTPQKQAEIIHNILVRIDQSGNGWDAYPGGPIDMNVTSFTLHILQQFGMGPEHPAVARAWSYFNSHGADKDLSTPFKLYLISLGLRDDASMILPTPHELITAPPNIYLSKFGLIGDMFYPFIALKILRKIPDGGWKDYSLKADQYATQTIHIGPGTREETVEEALRPPAHDVKLVREILSLTLKNRGTNGAWYGTCFSSFDLLLFHEAQRAGLGDFSDVINKGWAASLTWEVPSENGTRSVETMRSDIWDTSAILTAFSYLPPALGQRVQEFQPQKSVRWLLDHRNSLGGHIHSFWSFDSTDSARPDSDDSGAALYTIARYRSFIPQTELKDVINDGVNATLLLENDDGGFAAWSKGVSTAVFWVLRNTIGFPHMADISQADITGRVVRVFDELKDDGLVNPDVTDKLDQRVCGFFNDNAQTFHNIPVKTFVGHWFSNYIYASAQLITGLKSAHCANAVSWTADLSKWIMSVQQQDGGWGEDNASYAKNEYVEGRTTLAQTALAIAGLIDAYELLKATQPALAAQVASSIDKGLVHLSKRTNGGKYYYEPDFTAILIKGVQYARNELLPAYMGLYDFARWYRIKYVNNTKGK